MIFKLVLVLILSLFLSSCSNKTPSEPVIIEPQVSTPEVQVSTREALFTYGETTQTKKIHLTFSTEPIQLKEGYVKLIGIIAGSNPLACLEIGGRGVVVGLGEMVESYVVRKINKKEVVLCLEK